uniref:Amidase domain-containing protein n=1 Tax=Strongyloides stercoralis TaxID=6248 RepID=A0A0K0DUS4_STRER
MNTTISWVCSKNFSDFVKLPDIEKYKKECNYYDINGNLYIKIRPKGCKVSLLNKNYQKQFCSINMHKQLIIYFTKNRGLVLSLNDIIGIQNNCKFIKTKKAVWSIEGVIIFSFGKIKIATHHYNILNLKYKLSMLFCKISPEHIKNKKERGDGNISQDNIVYERNIYDISYDYNIINDEFLKKEVDDICYKIEKLQLKDSIKYSQLTFLKQSSC